MTAGELGTIAGAIITGLAGVGTILKIAASGIQGAIERNTNTMMTFVASAARLEVKLDQAHASSQRTEDVVAGVVEIVEEISGVHQAAPGQTEPWKTPPGGYSIHRKKTEGR